jgi:hypothetical protein
MLIFPVREAASMKVFYGSDFAFLKRKICKKLLDKRYHLGLGPDPSR